jgi:Fe-S cluster assembly iron-binding protein IscA
MILVQYNKRQEVENMLKVTDKAVEKLTSLLKEQLASSLVRIVVKGLG